MKKLFSKILIFVLLLSPIALFMPEMFAFADEEEVVQTINITSTEDFVSAMSQSTTFDNSNVVIKLENDLDFAGVNLSSLYQTSKVFYGTFDGNGFSISNIALSSQTYNYGLFGRTNGATIKNLRISGDVSFSFRADNINQLYAGVLVGYAENTTFENCELDNTKLVAQEEAEENETLQTEASIDFEVYSDIDIGAIAGKLKGSSSLIKNCVSFYDMNLIINKGATVNAGAIVGQIEQAKVLNTISYGDINIRSSIVGESDKTQNLGGISGYAYGSNSTVKNSCYNGRMQEGEELNALNISKGAVIGKVSSSSQPNADNINFDYWTAGLNAVGSGIVLNSTKLKRVDIINQSFLLQTDYFDLSLPAWDFDKTWSLVNSQIHLQNFQTFDFSLNEILDVTGIFKDASFSSGSQENVRTLSVKYGEIVEINLNLKENYYGFYSLNGVLLNSNTNLTLEKDFSEYAVKNLENAVTGYKIQIKANDTTDGSYSFTASANLFNCVVTVSEDAKENNQGGVRSADASSVTQEMPIVFSYNATLKRIVAVGNGIYSFEHWQLYYYGEDGTTLIPVDFESKYSSTLSVSFGTSPFNRQFKLVAYFSSENAVKVDFAGFDGNKIKTLILNTQTYSGEEIVIPPRANIQLELIIEKNYKLNEEKFIADFQRKYGENTIRLTTEPIENDEKETTYKFEIMMRNTSGIEGNKMEVSLASIEKDKSAKSNLTWIYIVAGIAVVVGATAVVVIMIVRKKGGPKGKGKGKSSSKKTQSTTNYSSYNDYYI